jgi:hypothetical protein
MKKWLPLLDSLSLGALILAMCSQVDVRRVGRDTLAEGLGYATKTLAVALSDVVFLLVVLWFVARTIQMRGWKRLWWPPLPCFALIFVMILSALHSAPIWAAVSASLAESGFGPRALITKESKEAIAEIVQWSAYFLVAPWLFANLMHDRRGEIFVSRRQLAIGVFSFAVLASGLAAVAQGQNFVASAPRGFFASPNTYAAFLALALPLLLEVEVEEPRTQIRFWMVAAALIFVALSTVASPWAIGAIGVGLVFAVLARVGGVKIKAFRLAIVVGLAIVALGSWNTSRAMQPFRSEFTRVGSPQRIVNGETLPAQKVKKQLVEWAAALGWSVPRERAFATGVGPGNYQLNIGPLYNSLPNEEKMPPDSNNLYLVQAVSIGILGLASLLWVVLHFWTLAWRAAKRNPADWLGAGVVGALSSWLFVNAFHALIVRGAGLVLAFLFALAVVAAQTERNETADSSVEKPI